MAKDWGVLLIFDGKKICFVKKQSKVGEKKCIKCWRARSGMLDRNLNTQSNLQTERNKGPIPEGKYMVSIEQLEKRFDKSGKEKEIWKSRSREAWGDMRMHILHYNDTNTYGRSEFFIHGGEHFGSIGCIDLSSKKKNEINFFSFWEKYYDEKGIEDNPIDLIVDYSEKYMPEDCKEPFIPRL